MAPYPPPHSSHAFQHRSLKERENGSTVLNLNLNLKIRVAVAASSRAALPTSPTPPNPPIPAPPSSAAPYLGSVDHGDAGCQQGGLLVVVEGGEEEDRIGYVRIACHLAELQQVLAVLSKARVVAS